MNDSLFFRNGSCAQMDTSFKWNRLNKKFVLRCSKRIRKGGHFLDATVLKKQHQKRRETKQNAQIEHTFHGVSFHRRGASANRCAAEHSKCTSLICRASSRFWSAAAAPSLTDSASPRRGSFPLRCCRCQKCL